MAVAHLVHILNQPVLFSLCWYSTNASWWARVWRTCSACSHRPFLRVYATRRKHLRT